MSALDFAARGMIARHKGNQKRSATLDTLARGIAQHLPPGLPAAMGTPIAEVRNAASQIASGTLYGLSSTTPANHFRHRYGLYGAEWDFNQSFELRGFNTHIGNGSNPAAGWGASPSGNIRFATFAEKFEIGARNLFGFRVKINGKYAKTGLYGVSALNGDTGGSTRYFTFDCAGGDFAGTGLKLVEIQSFTNFDFFGVRVPIGFTVQPWPQALPLKAALHGDSMPITVSDTGTDHRTSLHGLMPHIVQTLTGIPDIWSNCIGGVGFVNDGGVGGTGGVLSTFIEQASVDFTGEKFDLVWELGGRNDQAYYGTEAGYRAVIKSWLDCVIADNPDAIVFMTGPLSVANSENYANSAAMAAMQRAKRDACALYPRNCAFIPTIGTAVTTDPWIFGTGKQGATANNGNADLVTGNDGVHPTTFGHAYLGTRLVSETGRVLPLLASRIRDGVVAGVNDMDLTT